MFYFISHLPDQLATLATFTLKKKKSRWIYFSVPHTEDETGSTELSMKHHKISLHLFRRSLRGPANRFSTRGLFFKLLIYVVSDYFLVTFWRGVSVKLRKQRHQNITVRKICFKEVYFSTLDGQVVVTYHTLTEL